MRSRCSQKIVSPVLGTEVLNEDHIVRQQSIQEKFSAALNRLIEQVKLDRSILAAILCGSLSHDKVWAKSDIDLVLVTTDDKAFTEPSDGIALYADDVNVHAFLMPRLQFRKTV